MKNTITTILCLTMGAFAFCQTNKGGINTRTPQQALHVSGSTSAVTAVGGTTGDSLVTPTIRVDGLSQAYNSAHPPAPAVSVQSLYATAAGDLVIGKRTTILKQTLPGSDALVQGTLVVPDANTAGVVKTIYTQSFILNQSSRVFFNANLSYSFLPPGTTGTIGVIKDGQAKMAGIEFSFSSAPAASGISTSTYFAAEQNPYMQTGFSGTGLYGGGNVPNGNFIFNLGKSLQLPAGTYTFNVIISGSAGTGTGFNLVYGNGPNDQINITAVAL